MSSDFSRLQKGYAVWFLVHGKKWECKEARLSSCPGTFPQPEPYHGMVTQKLVSNREERVELCRSRFVSFPPLPPKLFRALLEENHNHIGLFHPWKSPIIHPILHPILHPVFHPTYIPFYIPSYIPFYIPSYNPSYIPFSIPLTSHLTSHLTSDFTSHLTSYFTSHLTLGQLLSNEKVGARI